MSFPTHLRSTPFRSQSIISLRAWHRRSRRAFVKTLSLVIAFTFVFPYLTWAFTPAAFPQAAHAVAFNQKPVEIPADFGTVIESNQGREGLVVCVQDLHCNYEVQTNIARLIDRLAGQYGLKLVAVEGADQPLDVSLLADFPREKPKRMAADYLLREGKITGAELYAATGEHAIALEGIEDTALYDASLAAVMKILNDESQGYVYDLREALEAVKPVV